MAEDDQEQYRLSQT